MLSRYPDWLRQANEDLNWANDTFDHNYYPQTCFICQQAGEKALKSYAFFTGNAEVRSYSIVKIAQALNINNEIYHAGQKLDQYYISGRYPDSLPEGIPSEFITRDQAEESLALAKIIIDKITDKIENEK